MSKNGFSMWVREQIDAQGYASDEEAARALRVYPSLIRQWTSMVRVPSPEVLRRVAALFDAPIQEVLIASGYMTEEESRSMDAATTSLRQFSTDQILDELRRRASLDSGVSPIPVRVDGVIDQHRLPSARVNGSGDVRGSPRREKCLTRVTSDRTAGEACIDVGGSDANWTLPNEYCPER